MILQPALLRDLARFVVRLETAALYVSCCLLYEWHAALAKIIKPRSANRNFILMGSFFAFLYVVKTFLRRSL